jgi:hypothetical protein
MSPACRRTGSVGPLEIRSTAPRQLLRVANNSECIGAPVQGIGQGSREQGQGSAAFRESCRSVQEGALHILGVLLPRRVGELLAGQVMLLASRLHQEGGR